MIAASICNVSPTVVTYTTNMASQTGLGPTEPPGVALTAARPRDSGESGESDVDPREALELQEIQTREDNELDQSTHSASSGDEYRVVTRRTTSRALAARADARQRHQARKGAWGKLTRFWTHHVTLTVPHKSNRDYFGGLSLSHLVLRSLYLLPPSFGKDISRLYTHISCHYTTRGTCRAAFPFTGGRCSG